jgi:hypothetical protein
MTASFDAVGCICCVATGSERPLGHALTCRPIARPHRRAWNKGMLCRTKTASEQAGWAGARTRPSVHFRQALGSARRGHPDLRTDPIERCGYCHAVTSDRRYIDIQTARPVPAQATPRAAARRPTKASGMPAMGENIIRYRMIRYSLPCKRRPEQHWQLVTDASCRSATSKSPPTPRRSSLMRKSVRQRRRGQ